MLIKAILEDRNELVSGNAACMNIKQSSNLQEYSKVSIIRPGRSRFLHRMWKKDGTGCLIETFSKYPDQVV